MEILRGIPYETVVKSVKSRLEGFTPEYFGDGYVDISIDLDSRILDDLGIRDEKKRGEISILEPNNDSIWLWAIVKKPYVRKKDKGNIGHYLIADSETCDTVRFCSPKLYRAIKEVCDAGLKEAYRDYVNELEEE